MQNIAWAALLLVQTAAGLTLPSWSDIFSGLKPYRDPDQPPTYVGPLTSGKELTQDDMEDYELNLYEQGSPRFGIVQVFLSVN